jgi:hypothetical protein
VAVLEIPRLHDLTLEAFRMEQRLRGDSKAPPRIAYNGTLGYAGGCGPGKNVSMTRGLLLAAGCWVGTAARPCHGAHPEQTFRPHGLVRCKKARYFGYRSCCGLCDLENTRTKF